MQNALILPGRVLFSHHHLQISIWDSYIFFFQLTPTVCSLSDIPQSCHREKTGSPFFFSSPTNWIFLAMCQQTLGAEPAHIPFPGITLDLLGIEMKGAGVYPSISRQKVEHEQSRQAEK